MSTLGRARTVRRLGNVASTSMKPKVKTFADDVKEGTGKVTSMKQAWADLVIQADQQAEDATADLSETVRETLKLEDKVTGWDSDTKVASREIMERIKQVAEIRVDKNQAVRNTSLIDTNEEGKMLVTLFKSALSHHALEIDDATRQLLVNLLHDQAVADDQAAGQDRLVKNILGTDKDITELKGQLQTVITERDDLQSRLEGLTRDHDAATAKNEELTNELAELQQNQPDAELPKRVEELEKSNAEMENELVTWRSGEEMWQKEVKKKDEQIDCLGIELNQQKRLYKYMKDLHGKTVGAFTKDLKRMDTRFEEWQAVVHDSLEQRIEDLERRNQSLDSELSKANRSLRRAQEEVVRAQGEVVRARGEVVKLKDAMSDFQKAKNEGDALAALKLQELAELKRKARQQELDIVVLEESYNSVQQNLEQARQQISQIQLDLNEMREQAHDTRTEAEQAWAEVTRLEQERTTMQQLAEEIQQSNAALTGQNQEQCLAINSLEQDTQHFIRIMGSLTGVQLDPDSWNTAVRLAGTPVHGLDELTPFWRVDQSWGETRSMFEYRPSQSSSEMLTNCFSLFATLVTSSDEVDWRNRAVQVTQCLMRELQGADEAQIYVGFLEEFANLVARLIDQGRLQNNDPLVFSIWELLACANEMLTGMLGQPTNLLEQRLGGHWVALSRAMRAGYTHVTEEAISNLFREGEYLRAPGMGVLLDNERLTGARLYIVLDFNPNARAVRVMEGRIWSPVDEGGNFGAVCFRGSDDLTVTIPLAHPKDMMWWLHSVDNMEVD